MAELVPRADFQKRIPVALNIGSYAGQYRMLALLMTGQTSQVWEAVHDVRQQRYAVKVLLSDHRRDREQRNFLKHEYEVGRKLDHPRIIKMVELGSYDGDPFLALELYRNPNLKYLLLREQPRLYWQATKIIREAAEGLAYLHQQGWVHRDVKPDNFLVSAEGDVKLIDFAMAQRAKGALARLFSRRTKVQGTRSYMSPEQIRGKALDFRADIYSFGCTIHELLTGKPPFTGSDTNELLNRHLSAAIPTIEASNRNVTPEFSGLVRRMLAKMPDKRPANMDDVLSELASLKLFKQPPKSPEELAREEKAG
jgi:serine/threonine protein kinase